MGDVWDIFVPGWVLGLRFHSTLTRGDLPGGDAPDFVEVGEAGIAVDHAMQR